MRVIARGWGRDHGEKGIIEDDLTEAPVKTGYFWPSMSQAYVQIERSVAGSTVSPPTVLIAKGTPLTLSGKYLVQLELSQREIARLFYLTHSDKELHELVGMFATFKQQQDREAEAEAQRQAAKAVKPIRRL